MTVLWAKQAYDDLDEIARYLAGLSNDVAERTIDRIQNAVLLLGEFPEMGAKVDETGLRKLVVSDTPYVAFQVRTADLKGGGRRYGFEFPVTNFDLPKGGPHFGYI